MQRAAIGHRLKGILGEIEEGLFDLITIHVDCRKGLGAHDFDINIAIGHFVPKQRERLLQYGLDQNRFHIGFCRTNGPQKLCDDQIQSGDLIARHIHQLLQVSNLIRQRGWLGGFRALATKASPNRMHLAIQKLQMNVQCVQRIANLMRNTGGKQLHGVQAFGLQHRGLLQAILRHVAQNHNNAARVNVIGTQWNHVEAHVTMLGVGDFNLARDQF